MNEKKTIIVVFTAAKLTKAESGKLKRYAFNTSSEVKEGEMLQSDQYTTSMQVVMVLEKSFKYYNITTGDLSNDYSSSRQYEIKYLAIVESTDKETVFAKRIS